MSGWRGVRRRAKVGLVVLAIMVLLALLAPILATHDPRHAEPGDALQAPSGAHWLGTDRLGRDVYSRVLYGGRRTLGVAAVTVLISLLPGLLIGLLAGSGSRALDAGLMALMDALLAFPSLLLALALVALLGNGLWQVAGAVGIAGVPAYARVVRAAVLEARSGEYVTAARAIGARSAGILWRHVLPAASPALLSFAGVTLSWALLNSAALMFLGLGGDISAPDWGVMLADGRQAFRTAPWIAAAPGVALSLTVMAINLSAADLGRAPAGRG